MEKKDLAPSRGKRGRSPGTVRGKNGHLPTVRSVQNEFRGPAANQGGTVEVGEDSGVEKVNLTVHGDLPCREPFVIQVDGYSLVTHQGGSDEMESWIADYEVDLGFCSKRPAFAFDFIHLIHDPMIAVLPPVYEVPVDMKSFPISEFNGKPFILSEEGIDYDINNILEKTKTHPDIILSAKDDATIISMVEHGVGLAILPELSCKGRPGYYKTMPLEPHYSRDLGIGVNSLNNATPITRSFIYAVQSYFDKANNQPLTAPV